MEINYSINIINYDTTQSSEFVTNENDEIITATTFNYVNRITFLIVGNNDNNVSSQVEKIKSFSEFDGLVYNDVSELTDLNLINFINNRFQLSEERQIIAINIYKIIDPIEYKWYIYSTEVVPSYFGFPNYICKVRWRFHGTSTSGYTADLEGMSTFNNTDINNYIEYNDLKESDIITWIESTNDYYNYVYKIDRDIYYKSQILLLTPPVP